VDHPFANLEDFASRPAVVTPAGEVVSYADLAARADALAAPMRACRGLLALEAANDLDPLLAFVGACRAGCPVMLLGPGDLDANPHLRERFRPDHEYRRHDGDGWKLTGGGGPAADDLHPDLAVLLSTSGSTGSAKLVRLSAGNIVANARSIAEYLGIDGRERAITALPMQYSFGMSIVTSHLTAGASLVLTDRSVLDACFWDVFRAHGCTSFSGVPRTFEILRQNGVLERDLPGLRTVTQAGGRLAPEHVRAVGDWAAGQGARFFVMYGQTEAAPRMSYLPPERLHDGADCIGMAIPGGELLLRDDDGAVIDTPDTPGELCYRGPNVMMGYAAHRADFARGAELDELRTGDIARRRLDGLFRIVGRASRFVKIVGLRVGLDDVEALLRREGVAACVAGDDTRVVAAVEDGARDTDALKADLVARLHLPATAVGWCTSRSCRSCPAASPITRRCWPPVRAPITTPGRWTCARGWRPSCIATTSRTTRRSCPRAVTRSATWRAPSLSRRTSDAPSPAGSTVPWPISAAATSTWWRPNTATAAGSTRCWCPGPWPSPWP
jgi:acyl-CoA synthetase (AMP-forming)/AMP-acid ligase II